MHRVEAGNMSFQFSVARGGLTVGRVSGLVQGGQKRFQFATFSRSDDQAQ